MSGEAINARTRLIHRGSGHGTSERWSGIGEDPSRARVAASTSRQAAALAGVGQGHTTVEAGLPASACGRLRRARGTIVGPILILWD